MLNIKDFTDKELDKQIQNAQDDMDQFEYGTGDYNRAVAELAIAKEEKKKREMRRG